MDTFTLIPSPQICITKKEPGIRFLIDQTQSAPAISKILRSSREPEAELGFQIVQLTLSEFCSQTALTLPDAFSAEEGYALSIAQGSVLIGSETEAGRFYALSTLSQMIASSTEPALPALTLIDWPDLKLRAFNLCYHVISENLPSLAPTFDVVISMIEQYANMKMNAVVFEFESMFPFQQYPQISNQVHFTRAQILQLKQACDENHVQMIPLVQSLGHTYYVLRHQRFSHLREVPRTTQQYCPCNPQARDFYLHLVEEILEVFGNIRYFHLGGDESRRLGECPVCAEKLKLQGMGHLFGDHINLLAQYFLDKGIQPIIWGDIFEEYADAFDVLDKRLLISYWNYDVIEWYRAFLMPNIMKAGFRTIGCSAAKFSFTTDYFYLYQKSMRNVVVMANECKRLENEGTMITDWPKFCSYEVSAPSVAYGAQAAWSQPCNQTEFGRRFSLLYFGCSIPDFDQICCNLSEVTWGNMKQKDDCWIPPYSNMHQTEQIDGLDRLDQSRSMGAIGRIIVENTRQAESARVMALLEQSYGRAAQALAALEANGKNVLHNRTMYRLLILAAKTMMLKSAYGIALDGAVKLLKYSLPDEQAQRETSMRELLNVREDWVALEKETHTALLESNFPEILQVAMPFHFPPEALVYLDKYADCLKRGVQLQGILSFQEQNTL